MTAKAMFEKLDMEQELNSNYIEYHIKNDMDYPYGYYGYILFDLEHKTYRSNFVTLSRFKEAINKQIEELGWNDET